MLVGVECFLVVERRVVGIASVEHLDIAVVNEVAEHTETGIPLEVLVDSALNVPRDADEVAFIFIEHARAIVLEDHFLGFLGPVVPGIVVE